jgi:putative endonuclease
MVGHRAAAKAVAAVTLERRRLGQLGEQLAADRLARQGYEIVERNYRCPAGEIDIVARLAGRWVFVEVRTRRGNRFGTPEESVTARKRAHLIASAEHYLQDHDAAEADWRIDAVAIVLTPRGSIERMDVIENAVTGA